MNNKTLITKGNGLEKIVARYRPSLPEEPATLHSPPMFSDLLPKFERALEYSLVGDLRYHIEEFMMVYPSRYAEYLRWVVEDILTPGEITSCAIATIPYETHPHYKQRAGLFFSRLIQNSYDAGHNYFVLDTHLAGLTDAHFLCAGLQGKEENPLTVEIIGKVGLLGASYSRHCSFLWSSYLQELATLFEDTTHSVFTFRNWEDAIDATYRENSRRVTDGSNTIYYLEPSGVEQKIG